MKALPITIILFLTLINLTIQAQVRSDMQQPYAMDDLQWKKLKNAVQEAKLLPTPAAQGGEESRFGQALSVDGNRALIGSPMFANSGAVHVYDYNGEVWKETAILIADDQEVGDNFGVSVSLWGERAMIGANSDDDFGTNSGSVYVFDLINGAWVQSSKISAGDSGSNHNFGQSVSLLDNRVFIGANQDSNNGILQGSVYVFEFQGGNWVQSQKLIADDAVDFNRFGGSVSLSMDKALIGAINLITRTGSVYVFDYDGFSWQQSQKLNPKDSVGGDEFGASVNLSLNRALIGAPNAESAYVFDLIGDTWVQQQKIIANDGEALDGFGGNVSLSGNRAIISASLDDDLGNKSGSAYAFDYDGTNWVQSEKITPSDGAANDEFGFSVSLFGDKILIGAHKNNDNGRNSGSVYAFENTDNTWVESQKINGGEGAAKDEFGYSVSLSGERAMVGAYLDDDNDFRNSGSVYVFDFINEAWQLTQKITAADGNTGDRFGFSVSLLGDRALIGANFDDDNGINSGSVYVFEFINGMWQQSQKLVASDAEENDRFGYSVSLSENRALIGSNRNDGAAEDSGSAYVFDLVDESWIQTQKLLASDGAAGDEFGTAVSLLGNRALIGAYLNDENGINSGSAYVFDFDGSVWMQSQKLFADTGIDEEAFGYAVSLSEDKALIGSFQDNGLGAGSAYVFDYKGVSWLQTHRFISDDESSTDRFGQAVSLEGNKALIGAKLFEQEGKRIGAVNVYEFEQGLWSLTQKLTAEDGLALDAFGQSISLSNDRALIGSFWDDDHGFDSGSAYVINIADSYFIGGTVSGLLDGNGMLIQNNGRDDTLISSNGPFVFNAPLLSNFDYDVQIMLQPENPIQPCEVLNGSGSYPEDDVDNVIINCGIGNDFIFRNGFESIPK